MTEIYGSLNVKGDVVAGGQFKNFKPESRATDPPTEELTEPRIWFNTNSQTLKYYDGAVVQSLGNITIDQMNAALADYSQKTDLEVFLTPQQLATALNNYVLKTEVADLLQPYAKTKDVVTRAAQSSAFFTIVTESALTHSITHNLNQKFPVIQCFDTDTGDLVRPDVVRCIDENNIYIQVRVPMVLKVNVVWTRPHDDVE